MVCFRLPAEHEEPVLAWAQEEGALGSETRDAGAGTTDFQVYFAAGAEAGPAAAVRRLESTLRRSVGARVESLADGRWAERYQERLRPFDVGARFRVFPGPAPPSEPPGAGSRLHLHIAPGQAFGTGDHATTALCVEFLEGRVTAGMHVLDVGTGSGILAIAAVRLGAARVVALEVDPVAVAVARENLALNRVSDRVDLVVGTTASVSGGWFDLLAANLRSRVLRELMPHLAALLRPGGSGVLSGVLAEEADSVEEAAAGRGLVPHLRRARGEWVALEVDKPA